MMTAGRKVDDEKLRLLWARADLTTQQIAEMLGVSRKTVNEACVRLGLAPRKPGVRKPDARKPDARKPDARVVPAPRRVLSAVPVVPVAPRPAPESATPEAGMTGFEVAVLRSEGRYAALAKAAARHGMTERQALQLWHRLRAAE